MMPRVSRSQRIGLDYGEPGIRRALTRLRREKPEFQPGDTHADSSPGVRGVIVEEQHKPEGLDQATMSSSRHPQEIVITI